MTLLLTYMHTHALHIYPPILLTQSVTDDYDFVFEDQIDFIMTDAMAGEHEVYYVLLLGKSVDTCVCAFVDNEGFVCSVQFFFGFITEQTLQLFVLFEVRHMICICI